MKKNQKKVSQEEVKSVCMTGLKKSFFQRQTEIPKPFFKSLKNDLYAAKGILASIIVALIASIILLGPLSYAYSPDNYTYITDTLFIGGYPMTDENGKEITDAEGTPLLAPPAITEGAGIDSMALELRLDRISRNFNKQTGTNVLECAVKTGHISFFDAKVTLVLDRNFSTLSSTPNFQSLQHYQVVFWVVFFFSTILGGIVLWFLAECCWYGIFALIRFTSKKKTITVSEKTPDYEEVKMESYQTA